MSILMNLYQSSEIVCSDNVSIKDAFMYLLEIVSGIRAQHKIVGYEGIHYVPLRIILFFHSCYPMSITIY